MAKLIPSVNPDKIGNWGERVVAKELVKRLPKSVVVFHSIGWIKRQRKGREFEEGECDFTILHPDLGVLFLEVKGYSLQYDSRVRKWRRTYGGGTTEFRTKDPFRQV